MSVYTEADKKIDDTKDLLKQVWENISDIIKGDVYGTEDYKESYVDALMEVQTLLLKIKRLL